jgi:uncharacterized protein (DUF1800 family)
MPTQDIASLDSIAVPARPKAVDIGAPDKALALVSETSAQFSPAALSALAAALLAACGGGGGGGDGTATSGTPNNSGNPGAPAPPPVDPVTGAPVASAPPAVQPPAAPGFNNAPKANSDAEAARFLQQAQFSSKPDEIAAVRADTYATWLQQQFARPIAQTGWDWLEARGYGNDAIAKDYVYNSTIADYMVWSQLFTAPDSMRKRIALALSEFFVVSMQSMEIDWRGYTITAYWDILNKFAFGNYRELLEEITLCPAMGHYLNTRGNQKEDVARGRQPDENYAREVMQLFTVGLYKLNLDGSVVFENGKEAETYDADDVSNLARVFTGYDFDRTYFNLTGAFSYTIFRREYARQRMSFDATRHSTLAISFMDTNIPAGAGTRGPQAMKAALDGLFNHPNVGPFFAKQMIQRLVTSNPSKAYIARVASAFNNDGTGVRGNLKAVWTAVLLDDEARGAASLNNVEFGKVREPIVRFVQWGRSFNLKSLQNSWKIGELGSTSYGLGHSPLRAPSVFNFFRPGYVPPGTELAMRGATAPEMQIVNETTVGGYLNFMTDTMRNGMRVSQPGSISTNFVSPTVLDIVPDYSAELALINNTVSSDAEATRVAGAVADRLNTILCAGQFSAASLAVVKNALKLAMLQGQAANRITAASTEKVKLDFVVAGVLMTMASSDYLVQK